MRKGSLYILLVLMVSTLPLQACNKKQTATPLPVETNKDFRVIGYLLVDGSDAVTAASQVNFSAITHLNLAFINPNTTGSFDDNAALTQIVTLAHSHNVKVLMSIGGGSIPVYFKNFLADDKRNAFVKAITDEAAKYSFDGVDVDLEGDAVDSHYTQFVTELGDALAAQNKLMTAAVATWFGSSVTDGALAKFDFINIMSYDKTGPWAPGHPGQHAPYSMAVSDIAYWGTTRAVAKNKLNLGLPFYGYGFGDNNTTSTMHYSDIVSKYPGAENKDEITLHNGQTMYYNGIPTIKSKTTLALQQTGGVMIWELSQDATGDLSLLKNIHDVVQGK